MSALAVPEPLTVARALEIVRDLTRDKSFLDLPMGQEVGRYLANKRKRLTPRSQETWEGVLHKFVLHFPALELQDFELPAGGERLEAFLDHQWGDSAPRTMNRALVVIGDFFKYQRIHGRMTSNPTEVIEKAKERDPERPRFSPDEARAVIATASGRRDRIALRLLFHYGLRRQELLNVKVKHFDFARSELTVFGKGETVIDLPIPHAAFRTDWETWLMESGAQPDHFLMCSAKGNQHQLRQIPMEPASVRKIQEWWADRLRDAGVSHRGMHAARRFAGQTILDATGKIMAAQELLRHANVDTTVKAYVRLDKKQLSAAILQAVPDEEFE